MGADSVTPTFVDLTQGRSDAPTDARSAQED